MLWFHENGSMRIWSQVNSVILIFGLWICAELSKINIYDILGSTRTPFRTLSVITGHKFQGILKYYEFVFFCPSVLLSLQFCVFGFVPIFFLLFDYSFVLFFLLFFFQLTFFQLFEYLFITVVILVFLSGQFLRSLWPLISLYYELLI